jgi:hypothetical protein
MTRDDYFDQEDRVQEYWDRRHKQIDRKYDQKRLERENASARYFLRGAAEQSDGTSRAAAETNRHRPDKPELLKELKAQRVKVEQTFARMSDLPDYLHRAWLEKVQSLNPNDAQARPVLGSLESEVRGYRERYPYHLGYTRLGAAEVLSEQLLSLEVNLSLLDGCFLRYQTPDD